MRTILFSLSMIFFLQPMLKAEGPDKTGQKTNVSFTRKNFLQNPEALNFALAEIKMGDQFYDAGGWQYVDALFHYLNAWSINPDNAALNYKIGRAYLETYNKEKSLSFLEDAYALDPNVSYDLPLLLARSYHLNYMFDKALVMYEQFLTTKNRDVKPFEVASAELGLMQTYQAIAMFTNPRNYLVKTTGDEINSLYPDYCPVVTSDGTTMYYTSRRPGTTGGGRDARDFKYNEDIYKAELREGRWTTRQMGQITFNSETHDATVGISEDGSTMLIYRGLNGGDLYVSQQSNWESWSEPTALTEINTEWKESSAAISPDGDMLYFTSDRPGGYGGLDIYVSVLKADGRWGNPINLGSTINSAYDEEGISLGINGDVLYFSSNGPASMGGYDVFRSGHDENGWSVPQNMGYPLNTPDDDVFFTFTGDETYAYFSSERSDGYGSQDIYELQLIPEKNPMLLLSGLVVDKLSGLPVENSDVMIVDENGIETGIWNDLGTGTPMYSVEIESGKTYFISVRSEGYLPVEEAITPILSENGSENVIHVTELSMMDISSISLPNVFFDFDKYDLRASAIEDLNYVVRVMQNYPTLHLELSGHTDIVGSWDYNLALSHKRAITVYNYLINSGISEDRLRISWHSFDMPWGDNNTDVGRQFNRRTALKIISHNK